MSLALTFLVLWTALVFLVAYCLGRLTANSAIALSFWIAGLLFPVLALFVDVMLAVAGAVVGGCTAFLALRSTGEHKTHASNRPTDPPR